ncbi:MAG: GNAT family N-acetyltransferase [Myxococcales bacterium]|nr:GNAT family N-acetyltransferase [Myxococcales bacterium]
MITLQQAGPGDAETVLRFIRALAEFEHEPDAVEVDADTLRRQLAQQPAPFECWLACDGTEPVGFALMFPTYSTWRGRPGIWLEDLFVLPSHRGRGVGRRLLEHVAHLAVERGCGRLEWSVLDWNTDAIAFYERLGAERMTEWTTCRVSRGALAALARGAADGPR